MFKHARFIAQFLLKASIYFRFFSIQLLMLPFLFYCHSRACCRLFSLSFSGLESIVGENKALAVVRGLRDERGPASLGISTRESNKKSVMPETAHNVIASDSAAIPAESNKPRSPRRSLSLPPRDDIIIFRSDIVFFTVILGLDPRIK